ncbi:hypothetical protein ACQP2P_37695 [Dactylosporangium sp. CA-139114]|uniref:hypothetical protein n=1 Tax=Dactylosporangium sp. CA-139114 TaxID=3239931 RepID=UPI003D9739C3
MTVVPADRIGNPLDRCARLLRERWYGSAIVRLRPVGFSRRASVMLNLVHGGSAEIGRWLGRGGFRSRVDAPQLPGMPSGQSPIPPPLRFLTECILAGPPIPCLRSIAHSSQFTSAEQLHLPHTGNYSACAGNHDPDHAETHRTNTLKPGHRMMTRFGILA